MAEILIARGKVVGEINPEEVEQGPVELKCQNAPRHRQKSGEEPTFTVLRKDMVRLNPPGCQLCGKGPCRFSICSNE